MTPAVPVRVAVVGLGWAGRSIWLPRLREHPRFVVTAAVDPDPAVRATVAAEHAVEHPDLEVLADIAELGSDRFDLAVVAVPNHRHADIAELLLTAGIPVFLEKPVCLSSAEADRLAAAERAGDVTLLAGSAARYRADVSRLYGVAAGLGAIRHVDLAWVRARGIPDAGGCFTRREQSGGGALVDLGWHLLDTLIPLLGSVEFQQVVGTTSDDFVSDGAWAASWRHGEQEAPTGGGDVEDTARGFPGDRGRDLGVPAGELGLARGPRPHRDQRRGGRRNRLAALHLRLRAEPAGSLVAVGDPDRADHGGATAGRADRDRVPPPARRAAGDAGRPGLAGAGDRRGPADDRGHRAPLRIGALAQVRAAARPRRLMTSRTKHR